MDTFCLRSSPISDVTLPNTNSTMTVTISVELLEYCTVYTTFKTTQTPVIRGKPTTDSKKPLDSILTNTDTAAGGKINNLNQLYGLPFKYSVNCS